MTKLHRIDAVSSLVSGGGCVMHGDTIVEWHNDKPQPSEDAIDAELVRLQARQVIIDKIEELEAEVTQRRLRDSGSDDAGGNQAGRDWMKAKEEAIASERAKL
jgi:hypothetical protein